MAAPGSGAVGNLGVRPVLLDRRDAVLYPGDAGIHLALPDDLAFRSFQHEMALTHAPMKSHILLTDQSDTRQRLCARSCTGRPPTSTSSPRMSQKKRRLRSPFFTLLEIRLVLAAAGEAQAGQTGTKQGKSRRFGNLAAVLPEDVVCVI